MSGSTYSTVLKNLQSDTVYTVTVVPVYSAGEGQRMSENGKTCNYCMHIVIGVGNMLQWWSIQECLDADVKPLEDRLQGLKQPIQTGKSTSENYILHDSSEIFFSWVKNPFMSVQNELSGLSSWLSAPVRQKPSVRQPVIFWFISWYHPRTVKFYKPSHTNQTPLMITQSKP